MTLRIVGATLLGLGLWCARAAAFGKTPEAAAQTAPASGIAPQSAVNSVEIEWNAPPECPDAEAVKRYAERLLGQPLRAPRAQQVVARAKVRRNEAGNWELWLSLTSNSRVAEETLVAKQCAALGDATALKVALATDPVATARAIEGSAVNPPAPAETRAPELNRTATSTPNEESHPEAGVHSKSGAVGVRVAAGAGFGLLPGVAPSGALAIWYERATWRWDLAAHGALGSDARDQEISTIGAHLQLLSGSARACPLLRARAIEVPLCLGLEFGALRGEGFGVAEAKTSYSPWGALVLAPAVRLPLTGALFFWLEADGLASFLKPGFDVRNLGTVYVERALSARIYAGIEIRLRQ